MDFSVKTAKRTTLLEATPKLCARCRLPGHIVESRPKPGYVYRRYSCECGDRWSTVEIVVMDMDINFNLEDYLIKKYSEVDRNRIVEVLMGLLY